MACIVVDAPLVAIVAMLTAPRIARDAIEAYRLAQSPRNGTE